MLREKRVRRAQPDRQASKGRPVRRERRAILARKVQAATQGRSAHRGLAVRLALRDQRVNRDRQANPDPQVPRVLLVPQARSEKLVKPERPEWLRPRRTLPSHHAAVRAHY